MTSPFPGIDPFLERSGDWPDFHTSFLTYWRDLIADLLPDHYDVLIDSRVRFIETLGAKSKDSLPDLAVVSRGRPAPLPQERGGVATLRELEPVAVPLPRAVLEEVVERYIQIVRRPDRSLVTVLELLSPTNKEGAGYVEYVAKRSAFLQQEVHMVELDLLLGGQRLPMDEELPPGDCYAFVSRADREGYSDVYAWNLRRPLPKLPIPLKAPDPDIKFDLGALYALAYERGRYARKLNYEGLPGVPLRDEDRSWIAERVREWRAAAARA